MSIAAEAPRPVWPVVEKKPPKRCALTIIGYPADLHALRPLADGTYMQKRKLT